MTVHDMTSRVPTEDAEPRDSSWADYGLCRSADPEAWFPEKGQSSRAARAVCAGCPVRNLCLLDWWDASQNTAYRMIGVWGGLTEGERRKLQPADLASVRVSARAERRALSSAVDDALADAA